MKSQEFEIVTASFIPSSVDIDMLEEAIYDIEGEIDIPEIPTFFSTTQSPINDLYIAFFAEAITIFGILAFHISAGPHVSAGIVCSPYHIHIPTGEELIFSLKGKMLKTHFTSDCPFGKGTSHCLIDSFFFRNKKTRCAVFSGWEKEFISLDELVQFLTGYMLVS